MIISDEQVRMAAGYLRSSGGPAGRSTHDEHAQAPGELVARVRRQIEEAPDTRADRIAEARDVLDHDGFDAGDVAEKMIGRAISDALR